MSDAPKMIVGVALREKRVKSFLLPELFVKAKAKNMELVTINISHSLEEQGPFDLILHKIDGDDWRQKLTEYSLKHPETLIVDNYDSVHKLDDRQTMLMVVDELSPERLGAHTEVPRQLFVQMGTDPRDIPAIVEKAELRIPFVLKPMQANGTSNAHSLSVVLSKAGLHNVEPPFVLQEFVNHGGVLFKMYIIGDSVMVFRRMSLPDIPPIEQLVEHAQQGADMLKEAVPASEGIVKTNETSFAELSLGGSNHEKRVIPGKIDSFKTMLAQGAGLVEFNRISNVHMSEEDMADEKVKDPPAELMEALGLELRKKLGLHLFNVDILRQNGIDDKYFIVDINYMPGYERLPDFEDFFTDFLQTSILKHRAPIEEKLTHRANVKLWNQSPFPPLPGKKWINVKAAFALASLKSGSVKDDLTEPLVAGG